MNNLQKQQLSQEAQKLWQTNQAYEASKLIFEHIPREDRATWAGNILKAAYPHFPLAPDIEAVIQFTENANNWSQERQKEAMQIVDTVNRFSKRPPIPFPQLIYNLAAMVGKITYNAQHFPAPYDHNAGWKIGEILKQIAQGIDSQKFEENAWKQLCNEQFLELDQPIICHPACPICYYNSESLLSK